MKVEYRDIHQKPIRRGGHHKRLHVATEVRPIGRVRLGNKLLWTGEIIVITPERKARGMR